MYIGHLPDSGCGGITPRGANKGKTVQPHFGKEYQRGKEPFSTHEVRRHLKIAITLPNLIISKQ